MVGSNPRTLPFFVDKYECTEHIGGNMSDVYLAYDARADRSVVVKLMRPDQLDDFEVQSRFLEEGRLACQCSHPNIITTYVTDAGEFGPYIVMEHLQGRSLRDVLNAGGFPTIKMALQVAADMAEALLYLHELGILHRDIKPPNIFVLSNGHAKIFDFGIARGRQLGLTQAGNVLGSPNYMAPEQILGKAIDQRTDIYSFGVVMFEMLALSLPYQGSTIEEIACLILNASPDFSALRQRDIPEPLIQLVKCCLEKAPGNRPQSFRPICDAFREILVADLERSGNLSGSGTVSAPVEKQESGSHKVKWPLWAAAAVLAAAIIGLALFWQLSRRANTPYTDMKSVVSATPVKPVVAAANPAPLIEGKSGGMVLVPAGTALLGDGTKPAKLIPAFYIDKTEVSQDRFLRFCVETGRSIPADAAKGGSLPIVNVSFHDAVAFSRWAGERLPTADEWEKAARGPDGRKFPWGNTFASTAANVPATGNRRGTLEPVNSNAEGASPYGALNMLGNAWEWVNAAPSDSEDKRYNYYRTRLQNLNPPLSRHEPYFLIRGGSFRGPSSPAELAETLWDETPIPARVQINDVGFRCARDVQ